MCELQYEWGSCLAAIKLPSVCMHAILRVLSTGKLPSAPRQSLPCCLEGIHLAFAFSGVNTATEAFLKAAVKPAHWLTGSLAIIKLRVGRAYVLLCFCWFFVFVLFLILLLKRKASGYSTITPNSKKSLIKTQLILKLHEAHKEPIDLPN